MHATEDMKRATVAKHVTGGMKHLDSRMTTVSDTIPPAYDRSTTPPRHHAATPNMSPICSSLISKNVTVIITTSPLRSDPDVSMLHTTFQSLSLAGLSYCRKLLIVDHFDVGEPRLRKQSGRLPQANIDNYNERIKNFRSATWAEGTEVVELSEWHGFALAVKSALSLVTTPLVCIVQHDLAFRREIDTKPIVDVLLNEDHHVNYVYFKRDSQRKYDIRSNMQFGLDLGEPVQFETSEESSSTSVPLLRLPRYFDGTHIASVKWYHSLFSGQYLNGKELGSKGDFIDTNLGIYMQRKASERKELTTLPDGSKVSQGVLDLSDEFGCWLWAGEYDPLIQHLNGRKFLGAEEIASRKKGGNAHK